MMKSLVSSLCILFAASVFADSPVLPPMGLPKEYQQVESLTSTGTQYIVNCGYKRNKNTSRIEAVWDTSNFAGYNNGVCGTSRSVFGEQGTTDYSSFYFRYYSEKYIRSMANKSQEVKTGLTTLKIFFEESAATGTMHVVTASKEYDYIPSILPTGYAEGKVAQHPMGIFCHDYNGTATYKSALTLYSFKIWERDENGNEVLVCNFVPCYRRSDNKAGLYNVQSPLTQVFYPNASSVAGDDFLVGANVCNPNKLIVNNSPTTVPPSAGFSPTCGYTDLTPGVEVTATVANTSPVSESGAYRYTLTGWKRIVTGSSGVAVTNEDTTATCTFTPAEGDEVYLEWQWSKGPAVSSAFQVLDAEGAQIGGTYTDLAAAFAAATNDCTVVVAADSVWEAPIAVQDKHVTLKSADGHRYRLIRGSAEAGFVVRAADDQLYEPYSLYQDYSQEAYGVEGHAGSVGYESSRLCLTNLVIDGGSGDGVEGGCLVRLNGGIKCDHIPSGWKGHYNFAGFKAQDGSEIRNFTTVDDYLITMMKTNQYSIVRLYPGAKIHDVKGQKGVLTFPTGSSLFYFNLRMIGSEIYDCRSEGTPILWIGPRRLQWDKVRFVDCAITNNVVAGDAKGTVYFTSDDDGAAEYHAFSLAGDVRITDNFLLDGVTPANVRINSNTSIDIHKKLGPNAKIGLAFTTGSVKSNAVEGVQIGIVTPTADKGAASGIVYDGWPRKVGRIVDQTVIWTKLAGTYLFLR